MADTTFELSQLSTYFWDRSDEIRKRRPAGIDDIAVLPLLDAWESVLNWAKDARLSEAHADLIRHAANEAADRYGAYPRISGDLKGEALTGIGANLDAVLAVIAELEEAGDSSSNLDKYRDIVRNANEEAARSLGILVYVSERTSNLDQAVREAIDAAAEARQALALAKKAVTEGATSALERSFQTTAKANARASAWFRAATIVVLVGAVALGGVFALDPDIYASQDWHGLVYRVAVLSALAAIAAYLGRQASSHRRIATWAHAIEIQLKAFLGFVNEIQDIEARQTMFALFGKRVLEAPPDGKATSDDSVTNVIQPIVEQVARAARPSP